ncbi:MAG: stage III sporulation AC/AD family protein [Eubacteriales bacterium]|nr:stage III sporulation AC/AD family protein [Eubacteriales bacterium]
MSEFWKTTSLILLTVVLSLAVGKTERDISAVLGMTALCIAACTAVTILEPVLDYLVELQRLFNLPDGLVSVLLKAVGIALVAELSATVCTDAGNASLGKMLQILGGAAVLSLSVPMFRTLMTIIKEIL